MCEFQWGTIECRGDGYCWDADCAGYDPDDHSLPCPKCNTLGWLTAQKEEAESTVSYQGYDSGTGVSIWESAVRVAMRENPEGTPALLAEIGTVKALYEMDDNREIWIKTFTYDASGMAQISDLFIQED